VTGRIPFFFAQINKSWEYNRPSRFNLLESHLFHSSSLISHLIRIVVADFTSVNSFQEDLKFTSPSFYNLTPPPPPTSRPPTYDVQNYQTPTNTPNGTIPAENYYAATDIIKVFDKQKRFAQIRDTLRSFIRSRYRNF
jgi:hypothetical protein